jgi:hypothetical protein
MSELTICCRCDYNRRAAICKRKGQKIEARPDKTFDPRFPTMVEVYIDDKPIGVLYAELSDECAC